jgi:hypothetical protein
MSPEGRPRRGAPPTLSRVLSGLKLVGVLVVGLVFSEPPIPPPGADTDRPDANYRPARQKNVNPSDPPEGYYETSEPPLRTLVLRGLRKIAAAIRR